jgi:rhodanese-related sulfurtransferase
MKSHYVKFALTFGVMLLIIPLHAQKQNKFSTLKPADFKAKIEQTSNPCIIDVRSSDADFQAGHIAGAVHSNPTDILFLSEFKKLHSATDSIFVYCKMGKTSKSASKILAENGFVNIFNLKGGILAWEKKFPLVTE